MSRWLRFLYHASRSRRVLWLFAFGMLAIGIAGGCTLYFLRPGPPADLEGRLERAILASSPDDQIVVDPIDTQAIVLTTLARDLESKPRSFGEVLDVVPTLASWMPEAPTEALTILLVRHYPTADCELAGDLFATIQGMDLKAFDRLKSRATGERPARHTAHAVGLVHLSRGEFRSAHAWFAREGREPDALGSRRKAIACLTAVEDFATLRAFEADPAYAPIIGPGVRLTAAIHERDWPAIIRLVPLAQYTSLDPGTTALALVAALGWAFVLVHLGQVTPARPGTLFLSLLALVAGVASTTPTIYAVIWQDDMLGLSPNGDVIQSVLYYIGGVGVREEVCKLVLFLPFLPVLLRRDDELEVLIVASFVGLGFAMEENGNYFLESGGTAAVGRFLTANFFHTVLTGMNGLALFRAFSRGGPGVNEFLVVFGATILAHGGYDVLLSLPDAELGGVLAIVVYVLTCRFYFRYAHALRESVRMTISLSGAFVAGLSTLAAAMIVFLISRHGPADGMLIAVPQFAGTLVLLAMFFREFDEPLTA